MWCRRNFYKPWCWDGPWGWPWVRAQCLWGLQGVWGHKKQQEERKLCSFCTSALLPPAQACSTANLALSEDFSFLFLAVKWFMLLCGFYLIGASFPPFLTCSGFLPLCVISFLLFAWKERNSPKSLSSVPPDCSKALNSDISELAEDKEFLSSCSWWCWFKDNTRLRKRFYFALLWDGWGKDLGEFRGASQNQAECVPSAIHVFIFFSPIFAFSGLTFSVTAGC